MAEFCLDCWNKLMETQDPPKKFHLSEELDFCEECGQWKPVIICVRKRYRIKEHLESFIFLLRNKKRK